MIRFWEAWCRHLFPISDEELTASTFLEAGVNRYLLDFRF